MVERPIHRRVPLAVDAYNMAAVKDSPGIVQPAAIDLSEAQDCRHRVAYKWRGDYIQLIAADVNGDLIGLGCVVGQAAEDRLGTAEDLRN